MSDAFGYLRLMFASALLMTVRVLSPRKSILSRPMSATEWPSYWVMVTFPFVSSFVGTWSVTGVGAMRVAQAWTPSPRMKPSIERAASMMRCASGSLLYASSKSGEYWSGFFSFLWSAFGRVSLGSFESIFESFWPMKTGKPRTRFASLMACFALIVEYVMTLHTWSSP